MVDKSILMVHSQGLQPIPKLKTETAVCGHFEMVFNENQYQENLKCSWKPISEPKQKKTVKKQYQNHIQIESFTNKTETIFGFGFRYRFNHILILITLSIVENN